MIADQTRPPKETVIALDSWASSNTAGLKAPSVILGELRQALKLSDCKISLLEQRERGTTEEAIAIAIQNPATWTAIATIVVAYLRRHKGKTMALRIDDSEYKLTDYSASDVKKISESLSRRHDSSQSSWGKLSELTYNQTSDTNPDSRRVDDEKKST